MGSTHHKGEPERLPPGIISTEELQARLRKLAEESRQLKEEIRNLFGDPPERPRSRRSGEGDYE